MAALLDLPVVIEVARADGSQEQVRIGTARREGEHYVVRFTAPHDVAMPSQPPPQGGTIEDLEYIAARARRTLADTSKARWHAREKDLLNQVERELSRLKALEKPG